MSTNLFSQIRKLLGKSLRRRRSGDFAVVSRDRLVYETLEDRRLLAGVPFQSFHSHNLTGLLETGTHWEFDFADWNGDGTKDMFAINKQGTSGTTELSILDGATGYQSFLEVELETPLGQTDADWTFEVADYGGNGQLDLFAINRDFGGTTGVTVVSGFENPGTTPPTKPFTTLIGGLAPSPTVLHQTDATWEFQVADWNGDGTADIFAFDKTGAVVNGTQRTDLHIINGSGAYQTFEEHIITVLPATNSNWELLLGGNNDIVAVKKNGTGTNTTEVHVPTATNGFQSYFLQTSTALHETNANWQFEFKDMTGDGNDDLVAIATNGTGSGRTEVHVLTGLQEAPAPGSTVSLPTTDGGTVEGTIDAGTGTLLIELDGNNVTIPAALAGSKIEIRGPGSVSYEGVSSVGELAVDTSSFTLTSGAEINGNRFILKNNSTATIHGTVNTGSVDVFEGSDVTVVAGGQLAVNTSVDVDETSKLTVNGTVSGDVNANGPVSGNGAIVGNLAVDTSGIADPGLSPGRLRTGGLQATVGSRFVFELFGGTVASQYDQIDVTGTVQLGGATLQPILGFTPSLGQEFVIIRNDGTDAVSGIFQGLSEGASLNIAGKRFHITYRGGTGNDIVLQRNERPSGGSISLAVAEDLVLNGSVLHSDVDDDNTTVQLVSGPAHAAAFSLNPNGSFSYEPDTNFSGADSLTYRVSDGELLSSVYTVDIDVEPIADAPALTVQDAVGDENAQIPLDISSSLVDQDGSETLSLQISGVPGGVVLNQGTDQGGGVWSLTPSELQGLTLQSLDNQSFTLNVSATATEAATTQTATVNEPLNVTVDNVDPVIQSVNAPVINENGIATISGSFTDVGTLDTHTVEIDWGEGTTSPATVDPIARTFTANHQYLDDGPTGTPSNVYAIGVTLTDNDEGMDTASTTVTVNNVDPALDPLVLSDAVIDENGSVTVSGTFTDPGTLDTHEVVIKWGDGSADTVVQLTSGERSFSATHQYLDDDPTATPSDQYSITATVTDDDTGVDSASTTITVDNVAPEFTSVSTSAPHGSDVAEHDDVIITADFIDAGVLDTHTAMIDWGDGSSSAASIDQGAGSGTLAATHAYAAGGIYLVTITLVDDDGDSAVESTMAVISGSGIVDGVLYVIGTSGDDHVHINGFGRNNVKVHSDFFVDGPHRNYSQNDFGQIAVYLYSGDDRLTTAGNVTTPLLARGGDGDDRVHLAGGPAIMLGGAGDDDILGGRGRNVLIGGAGSNTLKAGRGGDLLVGGSTNLDDDDAALFDLLELWNGSNSFDERVDEVVDLLTIDHDPLGTNRLHGGASHDLVFSDLDDVLKGNKKKMRVIV
ncbi:MAG: Ig-like domain-containing protein [Candidatus Paceibacterota bacterium]